MINKPKFPVILYYWGAKDLEYITCYPNYIERTFFLDVIYFGFLDDDQRPWYKIKINISDFFDIHVILHGALYRIDKYGNLVR